MLVNHPLSLIKIHAWNEGAHDVSEGNHLVRRVGYRHGAGMVLPEVLRTGTEQVCSLKRLDTL